MALRMKSFALATVATATLVACGGGGGGGGDTPPPSTPEIFTERVIIENGDTWLLTGNKGNKEASGEYTCINKENEAIPLPANHFKLDVESGGGILGDENIGTCKEIEYLDGKLQLVVEDGIEVILNPNEDSPIELAGEKGEKLQLITIKKEDKIFLSSLDGKYLGKTFDGLYNLRITENEEYEEKPKETTAVISKNGIDKTYLLTLGTNEEFFLSEASGALKAINKNDSKNDPNDYGIVTISTIGDNKYLTFDRTFTSEGTKKTGIYKFDISDIYDEVNDTDPRFGHGGSVGDAVNVVDDEKAKAPEGYVVSPAGFFVFQVSNLNDFATGQYFTAAKIAKSDTEFGYAFGTDFFSASTKNGWEDVNWSYGNTDEHFGRAFFNGQLLTTCKLHPTQYAGSELQIIAFSKAAKVVTKASDLIGKSFVEYSCGMEYEEIQAGKKPFDVTETLSISSTAVNGAYGSIPLSKFKPALEEGSILKDSGTNDNGSVWEHNSYITAYKLNDKYFLIQKDQDSERDGNSSPYGLSLWVEK